MSNIQIQQGPDGIAVLKFDRPGSSANLLDRATLEELDGLLDSVAAARGVILVSAKDSIFVAGADLRQVTMMTAAEMEEYIAMGQRVFNKLAGLQGVTVAAIHGAALGGGYEMALACDYRVASKDKATRIGLPETKLGILPAWGGSTRLPRLIGVPKALDVILEGKVVSGSQALRLGMVDELVPRESLEAVAREWVSAGKHHTPLSHSVPVNAVIDAVIAPKVSGQVKKKTHGHYPAIEKAMEVVMAGASTWNEEESFARERKAIGELLGLESTRNLMRMFFLQERARKLAVPDAAGTMPSDQAKRVERVAVIGAGVMGAGIAQWVSARGMRVVLQDIDAKRVAAGFSHVSKLYGEAVRRRSMTSGEARAGMDRIAPASTEVPLGRMDLVIEAAVEKMEVKRSIFAGLERRVSSGTVLASNTSALSISELSAGLQEPGRVVGIHFFNPVHKMQLVEVVVGQFTTPATVQTAVRFVQSIGKLPVIVKDSPGFLVNRILLPYMVEAGLLFEAGATVEAIDDAMLDFGMPMGPMRLMDEVGLDIAQEVAATLSKAFPERIPVAPVLERMAAAGLLGRKSGQGFYVHGKNREAEVNRAVSAYQTGHLDLSRKELQDRMVLVMVNEAARCLDEGVVQSAADADFGMVMGTGFAPFRGGPLRYADAVGTGSVCATLDELARKSDEEKPGSGVRFQPCALLQLMEGKPFYEN